MISEEIGLNAALEAAEEKDRQQEAQIFNLSERLNAALAQRVQELARARSEFFEQIQQALGDRSDIRIVGDRFIFESDVLFASASADRSDAGKESLRRIADVIKSATASITGPRVRMPVFSQAQVRLPSAKPTDMSGRTVLPPSTSTTGVG